MTAAPGASAIDPAIYRNILANMADGVLTLDMTGRIVAFNPAAGRLLGIDPGAAVGRSFAEVFLLDPELDAFNELVIEAVHDRQIGQTRDVNIGPADQRLTLSATTTYLCDDAPSGRGRPLGVIVVLSDVTERRKRREIERLFGEYVDPRVLERLLSQADDLTQVAEWRVMTVSFTDLAGFTQLTELLTPRQLVDFLSIYFKAMTDPIVETGGVTDKFIGDAVMAFWGPPFTQGNHAAAACQAALRQVAAIGGLQDAARRLGLPVEHAAIRVRVGVATGPVIAGSIGTDASRTYTVLGDTVNVAARLEKMNKALGSSIAVNGAVREAADGAFTFLSVGAVELRGRAQPSAVFTLVSEGRPVH